MKQNEGKAQTDDSKKMEMVINALGITANMLARKLEYKSHSSVYHVLTGKNNLSPSMIDRMVRFIPIVNYDFLNNFELPILLGEEGVNAQSNALNIPLQQDSVESKIKVLLSVPSQLDRIEEMLIELIAREK